MKPGRAATFGKSAAQFLAGCVRQTVAAKPRKEPDGDDLLEAVKQWQQVFEHTPVMYFMVDPAGTVINVNTFGAEQLGYAAAELIGRSVLDVFFEEDRDFVRACVTLCLETVDQSHTWEIRKIRKDGSVLWVRDVEQLASAFSLIPDYLQSSEQGVTNLMDLGIQLGRRFRALKLWMVIRAFGVDGLAERIREHCRLARRMAGWIEAEPGFELVAPVPFSAVCFRAVPPGGPEEQDRFNERLLAEVNAAGPVLLSHTRLRDRYVIKVAIGNIRTTEEHVRRAWELVRATAESLSEG